MIKKLKFFFFLVGLTSMVNGQKLGLKFAADKGTDYFASDGSLQSSRWNSKAIGITYESPLSSKFLNSIETGLYLNFKNDKKQPYYLSDFSYSDYFDTGSEIKLFNYNKVEKIRELHIPVFFKQYFYLGKIILFSSIGPKLAFTVSDKMYYQTANEGIISKINVISDQAPRLYVYNLCIINAGFEYKKIQFSATLKTISPGGRKGPAWRTNIYPLSVYIGYMF